MTTQKTAPAPPRGVQSKEAVSGTDVDEISPAILPRPRQVDSGAPPVKDSITISNDKPTTPGNAGKKPQEKTKGQNSAKVQGSILAEHIPDMLAAIELFE